MTVTRRTVLDDEQLLHLIAKVVAWVQGEPTDAIDAVAKTVLYQDSAQQCAEDLGLA